MVNWTASGQLPDGHRRHAWANIFLWLFLWWLPLFIGSITSLFRNTFGGRRRAAVAAEAGAAAAPVGAAAAPAPATDPWYHRSRDLANIGRDVFLTLLAALLLAQSGVGVFHGFEVLMWVATAFALVWYLGALIAGRFNVLAPLWIILFIATAVTLFALGFRQQWDDKEYSNRHYVQNTDGTVYYLMED